MTTTLGYKATRKADGVLVVHNVPIFVECERGEVKFDAKWIAEAVRVAKANERGGYLPPLHIRHHEPATDINDSVRPAGFFRIIGASPMTFKGSRRLAVFADLIVTDPLAQGDVLAKRLPYRSVEIFDVERPELNSLALLDHEAPFLELPMLMVSGVDEEETTGADSNWITHVDTCVPGSQGLVAFATAKNPWKSRTSAKTDDGVVACFRYGHTAHLFLEDVLMDEDDKTTEDELDPKSANFADDEEGGEGKEDGGEGEGEDMSATLDVKAIVKAIESGEISVKDMDAIHAAIQAQQSASGQEEEPPNAAPAAAPGAGEAMSHKIDPKMQGRVDALEAKLKAREEADNTKTDVDVAMQRLEGRPLGSDLRDKLVKFRTENGAKAFKDYVDSLVDTFGVLPESSGSAATFAGQSNSAPAVAMKYQEHGSDAVNEAAKFAAEWRELRDRNHTRVSEERFVEINMARIGVMLKEASA